MLSFWLSQSYHLLHFLIAFVVIYMILPRLMFDPADGNFLDRSFSYFIQMVLFVIGIGYVLLVTKLYEVLGFLFATLFWIAFRKSKDPRRRGPVHSLPVVLFYDLVEGKYVIIMYFKKLTGWLRSQRGSLQRNLRNLALLLALGVCLVVFALAAYVRWYDPLHYVAPNMSDGYVTLAWIKYIDERILFHDGYYPQGLYFFLSSIGKLAFINLLYVMKYGGALITSGIVLSIYFAVSRFCERATPGIVAAAIYGLFGYLLLGWDWSRQAATNSQEFGLLFVLPATVFLYRYCRSGDLRSLVTGAAGLIIVGQVHPVAYGLMCIGVFSVMVVNVKRWRRAAVVAACAGVSLVTTVLPLLLATWSGKGLNQSAQDFATSQTQAVATVVQLAHLGWMDKLGIGCAVLLLALTYLTKRQAHALMAVFTITTFVVYEFGGALTQSLVLETRALDIWAVAAPVAIGGCLHALMTLLPKVVSRFDLAIPVVLAALAPLQPIVPYKMQWESAVAEYLQISDHYRYQGFEVVGSDELYAEVLGEGYRQSQAEFVKMFDPAKRPLTQYGESKPYYGIAPNIFIFVQKKVFEVSKTNSIYSIEEPLYAQRRADNQAMEQWLARYKAAGHKLQVYYEDQNIVIYYIQAAQPTPG